MLDLEWFGRLSNFRQTINDAFKRSQRGEVIMLVAEANRFPIGQVWIDLTLRRAEAIGVLWALRVFQPFQNMGIGSHLIAAAEEQLQRQGFRISELGVEKDNVDARRLYERLGYRVVRESIDVWTYTPPSGEIVQVTSEEWVMHKSIDET